MPNQELAEELHKPVNKKIKKRKVYLPLIDNIWGADLADMQLIRKFSKRICFVLFIFSVNTHRLFL